MKFLALFVALVVVVAMVSGQSSALNTNHNIIVIGKPPAGAPAAPAAQAAPAAGAAPAAK
ncbi:accessory gland-specific peptide 57Da [Drosophila elegans]|uniref:accessory gland-specific peptide 57Da n=1 Tax=Drosophila elegans TaxID=30023 RepID=UPI0007E68555|nr:accessory gland-specific peptide 57Da [Drosophila elegans]